MDGKYSAKEIETLTNSHISDLGLRKLIFGTEEIVFEDDIKVNPIACIYRCLSIAWIFSFVVWKNEVLAGINENESASANALRIRRCFKSVYDSESISLDLILFTLTEMHLDAINDRYSFYNDVFEVREKDFTINQLRQLIRVWQHSFKHAETNLNTVMEYYVFVIKLLEPLLSSLQVVIDGKEKVSFGYQGKIFDSFGIVKYVNQKAPYFYYLSNYALRGENVNLEYSDFIGSNIIEQEVPKDFFLHNFEWAVGKEKFSAIFAQKLYSVDYKYIHNLSLAISDIIDNDTKYRLFKAYVRTFPDAFKLLNLDEVTINDIETITNNANWDDIIAILMIELGPSAILEKVINKSDKIFESLAFNLQIRFWGKINAKKIIEEKTQKSVAESAIILKISSDVKEPDELLAKAKGNLMVQTIIRSVTSLAESQQDLSYNAAYVETINMRIKNLEKVIYKSQSDEEKTRALNKALEKTFHFLIAFYYGLISYADVLTRAQDSSSTLSITNPAIINTCEEAFLKTAAIKANECKKYSVGQSIGAFRELSEIFSSTSDGKERRINKTGELLKSVIGRDYLCDIKTFNRLSETVACTMNNDKHYKAEDGSMMAILSVENIDKAKELLYFFIYNKDYLDEKRLKQLISIDPIYPYVVRYCIKSENRDRFNVNNYVVNMSSDEMDLEVKLLTEKNYEINELYYCIPNMKGTLPKWWIKPFLIKCRDFDKLLI